MLTNDFGQEVSDLITKDDGIVRLSILGLLESALAEI